MIVEINLEYHIKPENEKRVFEILKGLKSHGADYPDEVLQEVFFRNGYQDSKKIGGDNSHHQDAVSKIWTYFERPTKARVDFWE